MVLNFGLNQDCTRSLEVVVSSAIVPSAGAPGPLDFREPVNRGLPSDFRELSDEEIFSLVQDIDRDGYAVLTQYIPHSDIDVVRRFVRDAVTAAGNRYVVLIGPTPVAETVLGKMASSPALRRICMRMYEIATSRPASDQPYYQVLRCLTGISGREHSMVFHFDSHVLALLLPIEVPAGKDNGELILLPNIRAISSWYVRIRIA